MSSSIRLKPDLAFSLIQLLMVITIIGAIAAIAFPAFNQAIISAKTTQSISNLHQLGLAANLYNEAEGGFPDTPTRLYPNYSKNFQIHASPCDPTTDGIGYLISKKDRPTEWLLPKQSYKTTYLGKFECTLTQLSIETEPSLTYGTSSAGLFADIAVPGWFEIDQDAFILKSGAHYHRVLEDSSVVERTYQILKNTVTDYPCSAYTWLLNDYSQAELIHECQHQ